VPVIAAAARTGDLDVYLSGLGNVTALNTAVVKSRVDGQLMRVAFHEGQLVRPGELLAEIDPRPFQVQLMQAQGQKAKDEAALQNARVDLRRYQVLMQEDSIPRQQLDTQAATVKQFEAAIESDQAQVESAKLNLTYSRVTAPIGGRVGLRLVDTGNIVHAADVTGLVMINQVQPITVIFTIPADSLPQVQRQLHAGRQLPVDAYDRDNTARLAGGVLAAVDNQIDQTTGTVRLRALFANPEDTLFPSQFVNVRLLVDTLRRTVLVPTAAIQRSPTATFVYVVRPDRTVAVRNVDVQLTQGDSTALRGGLAAGEVVVTDGVDRLRPGMKVAPTLAAAGPGGSAGAGTGRGRGGAASGAPPAGGPSGRGSRGGR
jgi:multidrug efflux system membrane fusion protein